MRRFYLLRNEDVNGFSGTGVVAEGIIFDDGTGAFTWLTPMKTVTVFLKMSDISKMHGHGGKTEVIVENRDKRFEECQAIARAKKSKEKSKKRAEEKND